MVRVQRIQLKRVASIGQECMMLVCRLSFRLLAHLLNLFACSRPSVLLGRGKRISEWPGNIHFRQVINRYREQYHKSNRKAKVKVRIEQ